MFNQRMYENARPDGMGVLEVVEGAEEALAQQRLFVPLKRSELRGEIAGPLADLRLVQTFGYSRGECDRTLQALYRFPLPGDAAVTHVRVRFGEVEIATQIREREQAEAEYKEAVEQGKQAALLTRESPDVFTLRVAGIQPDQEVIVETSYIQLARPRGDQASWMLRVPLTTAPRYVRSDELTSRHAQGQPLALLRDPGHRFSLDLVVLDAGQISSPTHRIDVLPEGSGYDRRVRLYDEEVIPDRDLVLTWTPRQETRPSLSVLLHDDPASAQTYFLALVAPPSAHQPGSGVPREVILLVDHSGSMEGAKWEASDWAVNTFFAHLNDHDLFDLGLFHSTTKWFAPEPRLAKPEEVQKAARYLDENRDSGGTELGVALEQALHLKRLDGKPLGGQPRGRYVLVVTDAQVTDAARILHLAGEEAKEPQRRRISVLCIDAAPNDFLARELAERGGGVAHFLTSSPEEEDITTALEDVLADWGEPVLVGLRLEVDRGGGEAAGREVIQQDRNKTTIDLGDLPYGRVVWVAGRVPRGKEGDALHFQLAAGREQVASCEVRLKDETGQRPALKALFGARRVLGLEYLIQAGLQDDMLREQLARLGYDPKSVLVGQRRAVYAENAREQAHQALKDLLVRESLAYGLASSETAFIAVRTEAGKRIEGSVAVANALPMDWSEGFLGAAAGAPMMATFMAPPSSPSAFPAQTAPVTRSPGLLKRIARPRQRMRAEAAPPSGAVFDATPEAEEAKLAGPVVVFAGIPAFANGQAVLLDSAQEDKLPAGATLSRLEVSLGAGAPKPDQLDRELALLLFVGDMAMPRAQIRLADLMRLGGARPLNLRRQGGQQVRIVLVDPNGTWASGAPEITVSLGLQ